MNRYLFVALFGLALSAMPATAQISVYGGGGAAMPTGDDLEDVDAGLMLFGGLTFDLSESLALYAEGAWGTHDTTQGTTVNPSSLMGGLIFGFGSEDAALSPYIFGGAGLQTVGTDAGGDPSETEFGYQFGAGVGFELFGLGSFLEGRYHAASYDADSDFGELDFALFTIAYGLSFDLGGDN